MRTCPPARRAITRRSRMARCPTISVSSRSMSRPSVCRVPSVVRSSFKGSSAIIGRHDPPFRVNDLSENDKASGVEPLNRSIRRRTEGVVTHCRSRASARIVTRTSRLSVVASIDAKCRGRHRSYPGPRPSRAGRFAPSWRHKTDSIRR